MDLLNRKLREAVRAADIDENCFVKAKQYHIPMSTLIKWKVKFSTINQIPGTIVVTLPNAAHQVLNLSTNFNGSCNFLPSEVSWLEPIRQYTPCNCRWTVTERLKFILGLKHIPDPKTYRKHGQDLSSYIKNIDDLVHRWNLAKRTLPVSNQPVVACSTCKLGFSCEGNLQRHMLTHQDVRERYDCDDCVRSYQRKDDLKRHRRIHHPTS